MRSTPLLILAYNRPDKMRDLIDSLRPLAPGKLMIAVDGPKPGRADDAERVAAVHREIEKIGWTDDVSTRLRETNLGLRAAVADAVSWAVDEHGQAVIIEDDVLPGAHFLPYAEHMLDAFRDDTSVEHVSGYNVVPPQRLRTSAAGSRLSIYPESFAWATWARAWEGYDPTLEWARNASVADLAAITGSRTAGLRWKQIFADAAAERISTWAYRWIASMWSRGAMTIAPNSNLVTYAGYDEGTHSVQDAPWQELPLFDGSTTDLLGSAVDTDREADAWVGRTVFGESPIGIAKGLAVSTVLEARKHWRRRR